MKKYISFISFAWIVFFTTSCVPELYIPYGVWASDNPGMIIYFQPDYQSQLPEMSDRFFGFYTNYGWGGIAVDVRIVAMARVANRFEIFYAHDLQRGRVSSGNVVMVGDWEIIENRMYYTLTPALQEKTGYEVIIFHRLENYDPINPEDWFP